VNAALEIDPSPWPLRILKDQEARYDADGAKPEEAAPTGFTMVQNRSVARHDLSLHALALLVKLLRRRNGGTHLCCPSYTILRKDCEHAGKMPSRRSISDWLQELAVAREIAWVHTGRHSVYHFPGDAEFEQASADLLAGLIGTATVPMEQTSTATVPQKYRSGTGIGTATVLKQEVLNKTNSTRPSAPTERAAPPPKPAPTIAAATPKQPVPTVEATPTEREHMPRAKRASAASDDGFGLVRWLLKEQGGVGLPSYRIAADAKAADAVLARMGTEEAAREHATARLMEPRRTTLLWAHVLEDLQRTEAARQRGVVERRPYAGQGNGQMSAAGQQEVLDKLLEDLERGHRGDDQDVEGAFGVWPEQRAEDQRQPEGGVGRVLAAGDGLRVRMVRPLGGAH
jgi:hypothetical protein